MIARRAALRAALVELAVIKPKVRKSSKKQLESGKRYYWKNRERCLERNRQWQKKNRKKLTAYAVERGRFYAVGVDAILELNLI